MIAEAFATEVQSAQSRKSFFSVSLWLNPQSEIGNRHAH